MPRKKIPTTVYLTPEQAEALRVLHDRTKVPVAEYVREGIDLVLERHADVLPGQVAIPGLEEPARRGSR
ncbi:MAG: ribbon-helix-helix domain-containing protein [Deltaproteobacteria bacterium]|nr:ribbon-helix-helix domain-containing protein [Deltaproteobacteria bacterium]